MATKIIMPTLGVTAEEGTIVRWLKRVGEAVRKEEPLLEVETEKAVMEVPAPAAGVLTEILAPEGSAVPVTQLIGWIGEPTAEPIDQPLVRVHSSPAARRVALELGVDLASASGSGPGGRVLEEDVRRSAVGAPSSARQVVTSVARKLALEKGVDLARVAGSGPGGRITTADVLVAAVAGVGGSTVGKEAVPVADVSAPAAPVAPPAPPSPAPAAIPALLDEGELVPLGRVRKVTAERMALSARSVARVTLLMEVDMSEAIRLRRQLSPEFERRYGARLTLDAMVVKAAALALREHPGLNARWEDGAVRRLRDVNVGLAVALDDGLVPPVIRQADRRPLGDVSREVDRLAEKARQGKLEPDDLAGGTFTVTNLGGYGVEAFTPIVNPPEAAILGVGRVAPRPTVVDGQVVVRDLMYLSLAFDHRIADGAPAAAFLRRIKEILESPYVLIVEG